MHLHGTDQLPAYWDKYVAFERSHYGPLYVEAKHRILGQWFPSKFFFCHFNTNEADEITSVLSFVVFPREDFLRLVEKDQKLGPKGLNAYTPYDINRSVPWLYLSSMIIESPLITPYLVRSVAAEIAQCRKSFKVRFKDVVSISINKRSHFLLQRYNFEKIGTCRNSADVWRTDPDRTLMVGIVTGG